MDAELEVVNRKLLAISWAMPPLVYPRAIQVSRSLKALSCRGWSLDVVAVDALGRDERRDDGFAALYQQFYRLHPVDLTGAVAWASQWWKRYSILSRLFPAIDAATWAWSKLAYRQSVALIESLAPEAFITFAQPWSDHLIGMAVKARFPSLPWIAHFSDPWVDSPYIQGQNTNVPKEWYRQEHDVIRQANAVVFVNEKSARLVMSKYPADWRKKVYVVPHGFDRDLLTSVSVPSRRAGRMKFVYTGSMFAGLRDPLKLLDAIAKLKEMVEPDLLPNFEFVGSADARYAQYANELKIEQVVQFVGPTNYLESLQAASEADILIVIDTNTPDSVFFPSKVVDYLMFGKPILALTPSGGATADVLEPLGHICVDSDNPAAIAAAIKRIMTDIAKIRAIVQDCQEAAATYRIANTTRQLELAIEGAIRQGRPIA